MDLVLRLRRGDEIRFRLPVLTTVVYVRSGPRGDLVYRHRVGGRVVNERRSKQLARVITEEVGMDSLVKPSVSPAEALREEREAR